MGNILFHLQFPALVIPDPYLYNTMFDSIDGMLQQKGGLGAITLDTHYVLLDSGANTYGYARLSKTPSDSLYVPTFDKKRTLELTAELTSPTDAQPLSTMGTGLISSSYGFGFRLVTRDLKGFTLDGGAYNYVTLKTYPPGDVADILKLKAILTPGLKVQFYIDDTLIDELTTHIPTGPAFSSMLFYLDSYASNAYASQLAVSALRVTQDK